MKEILKVGIMDKVKSIIKNLSNVSLGDIYKFHFYTFSEKKKALEQLAFSGDTTKEEDYDENDYILSGSAIDDLPKRVREFQYVLDQGRAWRTRNACVVVTWYTGICMALDIKPSREDFMEYLLYFEKKGLRKENAGASIPTITKEGCKVWNRIHPNQKVTYYRLHWSSKDVKRLLDKGYQAGGGHNTFYAYSQDVYDGYINKPNYKDWKRKGGHSLTQILGAVLRDRKIVEVWKKGQVIKHNNTTHSDNIHIVDNYATKRSASNIYEHKYIEQHHEEGIWYGWLYVIVAQDPEKVTKPKLVKDTKYHIRASAERARINGFWNGKDGKKNVTREDVATMVQRAYEKSIK